MITILVPIVVICAGVYNGHPKKQFILWGKAGFEATNIRQKNGLDLCSLRLKEKLIEVYCEFITITFEKFKT